MDDKKDTFIRKEILKDSGVILYAVVYSSNQFGVDNRYVNGNINVFEGKKTLFNMHSYN